MKISLGHYHLAAQDLARKFVKKYFGDADWFWIGDEIGDVVSVADYFFSFYDIIDYIKYNYSKKDLFDYYDYALDLAMKDQKPACIKYWKKIKGVRLK